MLSRASSSSSRLRRSKSTTSVKSRRSTASGPNSLDPGTAHLHALTAASIAMQRASQHTSMSAGGSQEFARTSESESVGLPVYRPRSRSIRFSDDDGISCSSSTPVPPVPPIPPVPQIDRLSSPCVSQGDASSSHARAIFSEANEFGSFDDPVLSAASSFGKVRRVRRAKSMFSTRPKAISSFDMSPPPRRHTLRPENNNGAEPQRQSTSRRSMSFFRGNQQPSQTLRHMESQEAAIQLARDQFLQEQRNANRGAESAPVAKQRPAPKPFRTTVRSTSTWSNGNDSLADNQSSTSGHRSIQKPRTLSFSLKQGLRRLLGRSTASKATIPAQQLNSHRLHFSDYVDSDVCGEHSSSYSISKDIHSRPASIRTMKSVDSFATSNSRVTSWTDSTATNTVTARQQTPGRNRLSIIQENGGPQSSIPSTPSVHYGDGYSVFRKPLQAIRREDGTTAVIDSRQVYSALVRRMDESNAEDGDKTPRAGTPRGSLRKTPSSIFSRKIRNTIRRIPSEASVKSCTRVSAPHKPSPSTQNHLSTTSKDIREAHGLTPQQIAHHNEIMTHLSLEKSPGVSKSPFASSDGFKSLSKARSVMSLHRPAVSSDDDTGSVIVSRPPPSGEFPMSPSVYSRATDCGSPRGYMSLEDQEPSGSSAERGTVTILGNHRVPYNTFKAKGSPGGGRMVRGSAEWRSWMKAQIDTIDSNSPRCGLESLAGKMTSNHYREDAQIHDESFDLQKLGLGSESEGRRPDLQKSSSEDVSNAVARPPLMELKSGPQNNFSRPLLPSPHTSVSISNTNVRKPTIVKDQPSTTSLRAAHILDSPSRESTGSPRSRSASITSSPSPLNYRKPRYPDVRKSPNTPTRDPPNARKTRSLQNRYGRDPTLYNQSGFLKSAHGFRFNSFRPPMDNPDVNDENARANNTDSAFRSNTSGNLAKLADLPSTIGSKRMVDLFLSDRRRQMNASEDSAGEPAFI